MISLDVRTLFYLFAISNAFIGLLLLIFNYKNRNQREITYYYLTSKFIQTIFWFLFAFREQWNIYITYVLANTLSLVGTYLEFFCFYFLDRRINYKTLFSGVLIILLSASSLFFFIESSPAIKVIHMSVLFIVLYLAGGLTLIFNHRGFNTIKIISLMSFIASVPFLLKFFIPTSNNSLLSPNFVIVANYIISYLLGFCWTILYLLTLHQIAQKEIRSKNLEIEADNIKLKELNTTKLKLFSIIAHDLRNPIQGILQLGQMLSGKLGPLSEADRNEAVNAINKSAYTVNNLLNNLLQWGHSESGKLTMERKPIMLHDVVADCQQLLSETIAQKNIHFENKISTESCAIADYNMIFTVLRNLIANAIKFTAEGGSVIVSYGKTNGKARIEVTDTGVGIASDICNQLFNSEFQYYTKGTNNEPGTGLGLKLCKEFVERNGGTIGAESIEEKGSTFYFTLPLNGQ
jgi:two-component system, sensor histidine kinase and response regulator